MNQTVRALVAGLAICTVAGCGESAGSDAVGVVSDSAGIRIVEFPASSTPPTRSALVDHDWIPGADLEVGRLGDVEPLPDGRVAVLDEMAGTVTLLSPEGAVITAFGGPGEGPGEFSAQGGVSRVISTDSTLLIPDIQLQRITEFTLDGEVAAILSMGSGQEPVYGVDWRAHPDGGIVFRVLSPTGDLLLRAEGLQRDTLHTFEMPARVGNGLLPPTPLWDVDTEGRVLVGRSDQAQVELRRPDGSAPEWIVRWPDEARPVSSGDLSHLENLLVSSAEAQGMGSLTADQRDRILGSVTFPESAPVFAGLLIDARGRIWIQRAAPITSMGPEALRVGSAAGFGSDEWLVLRDDGLLLERVTLPRGFSARRFEGACMYGVLEDELGVQSPARICSEP